MADGTFSPLLEGLVASQGQANVPRPVVGDFRGELLGQILHATGIKTTMEREAMNAGLRDSINQLINMGVPPKSVGIDIDQLAKQGIIHPITAAALNGVVGSPEFKQFQQQQELANVRGKNTLELARQGAALLSGGEGAGTVLAPGTPPQGAPAFEQQTEQQREAIEAASPGATGRAQAAASLAEQKRAAIEAQKTERERTAALLEQSRAATLSGFYSTGNLTLDQAKEMSDFAHGQIKKLSPETQAAVRMTPADLKAYQDRVTAARTQIGTLQSDAAAELAKIDERQRAEVGRMTQLGVPPAYSPEIAAKDQANVKARLNQGMAEVFARQGLNPDFTDPRMAAPVGQATQQKPGAAPAAQAPAASPAPAAAPTAGAKGALTPDLARQFLSQAGGNRQAAEKAATDAGYTF